MMNAVNNIAAALAASGSGKSDGGLIKATVVRGPSGEGVFTLRLSGGREVGVQVQAEGGGAALEPGQKVLVSPSDGKIFIPAPDAAEERPAQPQQWVQEQQPTQMRQTAQMLLRQIQGGDDIFISGKQQAEAAAEEGGGGGEAAKAAPAAGQEGLAKIVGFKVVSEGEGHADGIYRADAAGHILEGPQDGEAPIKDFAAVRLATVNGQQVVTVLAGDGLPAALEELRGSFESQLLRALPTDLLKDIFNERGFLDTDTLKALDAALANRNLSIDASSQLQMERIGQWLRIALDNPEMVQELVDRIPALGAKDTAGLLELIGRLSSGVAPESFFATENLLPQTGSSVGADLLQTLLKATFSMAPNALLNLVKQIDASSVILGAQLPPTEAARIAREITSALPAQTAAKPGSLHDAGQLSPRVLETNAAPAAKTQTPASAAPQIRAGYSELTEATVRALLGGGGKADAAAVAEKINALREAVARMPAAAPSGQNRESAARDGGISNNRTESNAAETNTRSAASRLSVSTNETFVNTAKAANASQNVNAQLAVHRASTPLGDINVNAGGGNAKTTGAFPAVNNRVFVSQQPPAQTGGGGASGINANSANNINTNNAAFSDNQNIRSDTGVNRPGVVDNARSVNNPGSVGINNNSNIRPVNNLGGMDVKTNGINASGADFANNQNIRGDTGVNRLGVVDNSRGVNISSGIGINTNSNVKPIDNVGGFGIGASGINNNGINNNSVNANSVNFADNQSTRGDAGINRPAAGDNVRNVNNSGGVGVNNNNNIRPTDNVGGMDVKTSGMNANGVNFTDNQNMRGDVGINRSGVVDNSRSVNNVGGIGINANNNIKSVDNIGGAGINASNINTSGINSANNQNVRGDFGVNNLNNRQGTVDNSRGVNTSGTNFTGNQNIRANTTATAPVDVPAIKERCLSIVDNLKSSAAPILREFSQRGAINAGGAASLIGLVRDTVASLDETLRPLVRSERPVPPEFYERVTTGATYRISAEAKNALFLQIGSAQALIRGAVEAAENAGGGNARINPIVNQNANSGNNTNVGTDFRPNISASANVNSAINQNFSPSINTSVNHSVNSNTNTIVNPNPNVNTAINQSINTNINTDAKTNPNVNANVNANIAPSANSNVNANVNTDNTNANVNPNANNNSRPDDFLQIARRIWANTEKLRAGFKEAFSTLDLQNRASPLDKPADGSTAGTVRLSADTLRTEMLLDVSRALRDVFSSVDELSEIISQLSSGKAALPDTEAALLRAMRALEHQSRQSGAEVMERLKDILKELNRLQADAARAQEQGAAAATRSSPAEAIRSAALTAARSLENLQLLSTQTRTAETEQHLLALPAKIGGEWTEVQIKFVKERKGEKGENKDGHVSIYLNVAPSALGQVSAHLDYHPPNLKLAFQFEKPAVTRWFRQQSAELKEALSQAGLPGASLEFYTKRPVNSDPATATPVRSSPNIDDGGADQADDFEVKNGRVDFKI